MPQQQSVRSGRRALHKSSNLSAQACCSSGRTLRSQAGSTSRRLAAASAYEKVRGHDVDLPAVAGTCDDLATLMAAASPSRGQDRHDYPCADCAIASVWQAPSSKGSAWHRWCSWSSEVNHEQAAKDLGWGLEPSGFGPSKTIKACQPKHFPGLLQLNPGRRQ